MKHKRTIEEINARIASGEVVVMTAEEILPLIKECGIEEATRKVDVVTTGTFSPMCSSGAFVNFGHSDPPIRMKNVLLNNVPAYAGLAAVDAYIGATEESLHTKNYGGAHVIEDLIAGKDIKLKATAPGTDCYPRQEIDTYINKNNINECFLFNPRNAYQNYGAATNSTDKMLYTYMGSLLPKFGNVTYATAGELSPLLNDPYFRTIGIGSKIFFGGAQGHIAWHGTQHNIYRERNEQGIPKGGSGTLSLIGDLKQMSTEYIRGAYFHNYGTSMFVGIGIPIPILDEDMMSCVAIENSRIQTSLFDYGIPERARPSLGTFTYEELRSGTIVLNGKKVRTAPLSSLKKARDIAQELKSWLNNKTFYLNEPASALPTPPPLQNLEIRGKGELN